MNYTKVTIANLMDKLNYVLGTKKVNKEAYILWSDVVDDESHYALKYGAPLGALLLGVEYYEKDDPEPHRVTMRIDPEPASELLN